MHCATPSLRSVGPNSTVIVHQKDYLHVSGLSISQADVPCHTFLFSPRNDSVVNRIVAAMLVNNSPPLPASTAMGLGSPQEVRILLMHGIPWQMQAPRAHLHATKSTLERMQLHIDQQESRR
jgi:hypothetical protein